MWFHKQGEFSKVVDIDQCFLVSKKVHAIYKRIKSDLLDSWIPVYDVKTHQGCLRHLVIREWIHTWHCMVNLALSDKRLNEYPKYQRTLDLLIERWSKELEEVTTMVLTINNWLADIVHGSDSTTQPCRWEWVIYEWLQFEWIDLLRFQVSPFSFFQTNTLGAQQLFTHAKRLLGKSITWNIIDLYCWSGTIGLSFLAQWIWKKVYGIEIVESAVKDAFNNAKINWLWDKCNFWAWKAEQLLLEGSLWEEAFVWNDIVIIDPPRSWLHPKVVDFLRKSKERFWFMLLYISCNPVTMWRDMEWLLEWWVFVLEKIQPVDMFPQTHHIEVIGVMK
jgi:23S rRNA (uracil1939-C5)-methyltransferase